jgi:hypothetical protein
MYLKETKNKKKKKYKLVVISYNKYKSIAAKNDWF